MAQETVDEAVKVFGFDVGGCVTESVRLVGSEGWSKNMFIGLVQRVSFLSPSSVSVSGDLSTDEWWSYVAFV